jgi:hypothetical protein
MNYSQSLSVLLLLDTLCRLGIIRRELYYQVSRILYFP